MPQQDAGALLLESIRTLAIAWRQLSAYPPGHPALAAALGNAHRRLSEVTSLTGRLALGVGADGLVFGDGTIRSPQAQKLAQTLYRRNVALLLLEEGVEAAELESFLRLLGDELSAPAKAPLWDELAAAGVRHIRLDPVDYSKVSLVEGRAESVEKEPESLWERILRALLAGRYLSAEGIDLRSERVLSAAGIGSLLAGYLGEEAAGGGGSGGMSEAGSGDGAGPGAGATGEGGGGARAAAEAVAGAVAQHLDRTHGPSRQITAQQITELVRSLPLKAREAVVVTAIRALSRDEADGEALRTAAVRFPADAVLRCLRRLNAEGEKLSSHAIRLAQALTPAPEPPKAGEAAAPEADGASLAAEVRELYREEDIDRLNPADQKALFERVVFEIGEIAAQEPGPVADLGGRLDSLDDDALAERLGLTLLELAGGNVHAEGLDRVLGRIEALFRQFVSSGRLEQATGHVETLHKIVASPECPKETRVLLQESLGRLGDRESIALLIEQLHGLAQQPVALVRRLIDLLGAAAARNFLFALSEETHRSRRRRLFDLLSSLGPVIVPTATDLLSDTRWYVVRNMIVLLHAVGDRSSLPDIRRCAKHPDLRVRLEAIKSLLAFDPAVPRDLLDKAIRDPDPKMAEAAIALAGQYGIAEAVDPLVSLLAGWDPFGRRRSMRLKALAALGVLANPDALPRLERFFRPRWFLPTVAVEERRAAYRSLQSYPLEARRPLVERGRGSRDPEIRATCERLSHTEEVPPPESE